MRDTRLGRLGRGACALFLLILRMANPCSPSQIGGVSSANLVLPGTQN